VWASEPPRVLRTRTRETLPGLREGHSHGLVSVNQRIGAHIDDVFPEPVGESSSEENEPVFRESRITLDTSS
jgi:hypothetical protein